MNHVLFAKISLSLLCALQGLATLVIDFNRTHATNPAWTGHARFHVVWQSFNVFLLSVLELALIWLPGPYQKSAFYLAVILTAVSPVGFLIAFIGRDLFEGKLSDANGIPPVRLALFRRDLSVDLNFAAIIAALLSLGVILAIY